MINKNNFLYKKIMFSVDKNMVSNLLSTFHIEDLSKILDDGSKYELEVKFTTTIENSTSSSVPRTNYVRLIEILDKDNNYNRKIELSKVEYYDDNIRKITNKETGEIIYEQKTQQHKNIDIKDYNIRFSLNKEKILKDNINIKNNITVRERTRYSYYNKILPIEIDITEVIQEKDKKITTNYEVEIEYHGKKSEINIFFDKIEEIFKLMKGTNNIYTNEMRKKLDFEAEFLLKNKNEKFPNKYYDNKIKSLYLVKARNIKYRDLVYGHIVANNSVKNTDILADKNKKGTDYYITYKADGVRKYLIIHSTGIWLVYPEEEYNLVIPYTDKNYKNLIDKYKNSIYDVELVTPNNNYKENPEYFVLTLDCICFEGKSKEGETYTSRLQYCETIASEFNNDNILTIRTKETKLLSENPEKFFATIKDLYIKRSKLEYDDDGFIFTPNNIIYNPLWITKSVKNVPGVYKWKHPEDLTIDFLVILDERLTILKLKIYDEETKQHVDFAGSNNYPFSQNNIRVKGKNFTLHESDTNKIIEFEPKREGKNIILQPRKYRKDKILANPKRVAEDVWNDINDPINIGDLLGETPELAIKYQNTVKTKLYSEVIDKYGENLSLLDIGSGRGGDIGRWKAFNGNIIAVEPYEINRNELIKRLNKSGIKDRVTIVPLGGEKTVEITKAIKQHIIAGKVDVVSLMLSMSFFWSSSDHLDSLIKTILTNLKPGGKIIFLTIDGDALEQVFGNNDEIIINGAKIYLYSPLGLPWGRPVDFDLPGSIIEEGGQREYVVHIQDFTKRLRDYGFVLENISRAEEPNLLLSEQNLLYTSMYSYGSYININHKKLKEFNSNIELPELPKVTKDSKILPETKKTNIQPSKSPKVTKKTDSDELEALTVTVRKNGPALNDDTYSPLKCSWYEGVYRIAIIGEGDCFIHSVLKCIDIDYQENNDGMYRRKRAVKVRYELAMILDYQNHDYDEFGDFTYWQTIGNCSFPRMVMQQILNPSIIEENGYDSSRDGLQKLFRSKSFLGNEIYKFIAEILDINVYIVSLTQDDIELAADRIYKKGRQNIVIAGNGYHFEVITIDVDGLFQTIFDDDDEFIKTLDLKYPLEKFDTIISDPLKIFIDDFISTFTINGKFEFPMEIYEMFTKDDPFIKMTESFIKMTE